MIGVVVALVAGGCVGDGDDAAEEIDVAQEASTTDAPVDGPTTGPAVDGEPPTADELRSVLPAIDDLTGGPWHYGTGVTSLAEDHEDEGPLSICGFSGSDDPANPLVHLLMTRSIEVGAGARWSSDDDTTEVNLVLAVVPDAASHLADARETFPTCDSAPSSIEWPAQGDEVAAFGSTGERLIGPDGGVPADVTTTIVLVRVGSVVAGLVRSSVDVPRTVIPGEPPEDGAVAPTDDELADLLAVAVDGVEALAAGEQPPPPSGPRPQDFVEALPPVDALPGPFEQDLEATPLAADPDDPQPVCEGAPGSRVGDVVALRVPDGAVAEYDPDDSDDAVVVTVALAPLADAATAVAAVTAELDACAAAGLDERGRTLSRRPDPALGDAALSWEVVPTDPGAYPRDRITSWLVAVGDVIVFVSFVEEAEDQDGLDGLRIDLADAEAFMTLAVQRAADLP